MEIWKSIDDRYSVSNMGRVKSNYANKERILKPWKNAYGYMMVDLRHGEVRNGVSVHRLVALAFIPNPHPDVYNEVNHKDEDKTNNCVENLEWCDTKYNCNFGTRNQRKSEHCRKPVCSVDVNGNVIHYDSVKEAALLTGLDSTNISKVLNSNSHKNKTAGGMIWLYDNGNIEQMVNNAEIKVFSREKRIYSIDKDGNIEYFHSIAEAKRITGIDNINRSIKNKTISGGRKWFYDSETANRNNFTNND